MKIYSSLAALLCVLCLVPVSAQAQTTAGSISGTVSDTSGAPVSGAVITLRGPSVYTTSSDAKGTFSIKNVAPSLYAISVTKPGYQTATQDNVPVFAGETQTVAVRMQVQTFTSLRTIASVRVGGATSINTSQASVNVVNSQEFLNQTAPQVTRVLSQIPGVQISFPSNSANAAAPGAITIPNIRGATSYETASLIDGHPISVGQYGDNVTTFLNSFMFGSVEVVKGPGADSPVVNNAIGGTTNFRTKDPTAKISTQVLAGFDNHGGTFSNFGVSDTLGKLGFVVDVASQSVSSSLDGRQVYYDPGYQLPYPTPYTINGVSYTDNSSPTTLGPTSSSVYNQFPLVVCCYTLHGFLNQVAELVKMRYHFSGATTATVSYLGGQSWSDQNGNTSAFIAGSAFTPDPSYTGSLKPGPMLVSNIYPGADNFEFNNEPIVQAEVSTTLGNDSILGRFYHAAIQRYQYQGTNPLANDTLAGTVYGSNYDPNNNLVVFNGTPATLSYPDYYNEPETDKLSGLTFEYVHPMGENSVSLSVDRTYAQSIDYSTYAGPFYSFNLPPGTNQTLTTYMLRGHFFSGPRLEATLTDYLNTYASTFPTACTGGNCNTYSAAVLGQGVTFGTSTYAHNDPRLGLTYRPSASSSIRFAMGSAIAPPFMGLLNQVATTPQISSSNPNVALTSVSNGSIRPETAFGYDLGADDRLKDGTIISGDVYLTNLFNRFFTQSYPTGLTCLQVACVDQNFNPITGPYPVLKQINTNISNARFEGIELVVSRQPRFGFGYRASLGLEKGYYYDLPPYFYCSVPGPGCTYDQNLNIISGQNTNGVGVGIGGLNYNGNMRIPYSQGDLQLSYAFKNGAYALFGETYYGTNNSLNEPPFGIGYATLRYPLRKGLALQVSGDNIFNAWPGILPVYGGGVPIPLANGQQAATTGNVLGPSTYRFSLIYNLP